jgi:hypothetical protein
MHNASSTSATTPSPPVPPEVSAARRRAALAMHSRNDARLTTRKARVAFRRKLEEEARASGATSARDIAQRADAAHRLHMETMTARSIQARRAKRAA